MAYLSSYAWPGNVRELHNVLQRAAVVAKSDLIESADLPPRVRGEEGASEARLAADAAAGGAKGADRLIPPDVENQPMTLDELERWAIETMMDRTDGNVSEVTRRLGIGRTTLYRKLKQYGVR